MKKLLNVLYVLSDDAYVSKIGTICVKVGDRKGSSTDHTIESIVCFAKTTFLRLFLNFVREEWGCRFSTAPVTSTVFGRSSSRKRPAAVNNTSQYDRKTKLAVGLY